MSIVITKTCRKCGAKLFGQARVCSACMLETALGPLGDDVDLKVGRRAPPMKEFGDYELLEEIGRGGQGVVYRARQKSLNRTVALKVIGLGAWSAEAHLKRFRREAEAAASLDHPRIVPIYEIGERDGSCYFSMKFVEGGRLDEIIAREPISICRAVELVVKLARTVHYAHQRGILHRDIKPGNILLDADGEPHLADFGLVRLVEKESTITRTVEVLGTPSYMAPEQAAGRNEQLTTAADVYGLGAVAYHLFTGQPPFAGGTTYETIHQVLETEPRRPSLLNHAVSRDLETICLKCLEKEPAKRYGSAEALAEDLERFLRDEPIRSRRISKPERVWRWCKRKPVIAGLAAGLIVVVLAGFVSVIWELRRAQADESIVRRNLYAADMNLAHRAWEEGNLQRAQTLLKAHLPAVGEEDLRGFEWRYLWQLCRDESGFTFSKINFAARTSTTLTVALREMVLAGDGHAVITANGNTLKWLDVQRHHEGQTLAVGNNIVTCLATAISQPGLLAYYSDKIHCISPSGEELLGGGVVHESCSTIALSPDGMLLASAGISRSTTVPVRLWNVKTGLKIGEYVPPGEAGGATSLVFSPDGKYLVCGGTDTKIQILETSTLRVLNVLESHRGFVIALAFDRTGKQLASGGNDNQIILWRFPEGREITRLTGHRGPVSDLAFSPDGQTLASAGMDRTLRVWNLGTPGMHTMLHGHRDGLRSVLFSSDGKELYTAGYDGTVKVWQMAAAESHSIFNNDRALFSVTFSPDGKLLAAADYFGRAAVIWDVASRKRWERTIGQHSKPLQRVAFSSDAKFLVTGGLDDEVQVWDLSEHKMSFRFPKAPGIFGIAFRPREPILAIVAQNVRFWDVRTGRETNLMVNPPSHGAIRVAFSPDGKWIAFGMENGSVSLWSLATGQQFGSFREHSSAVSQLCFSHDSKLLASAGDDYRIVLYDLPRRRPIKSIEGHTHLVWGLAFAPDDNSLVSTSWDGTIKFWCLANEQLALTLAHDGAPVQSVAFSPDGNLMATCGSDGTVRLWPAPPLAEINAAENRSPAQR